MKRFVEAFAQSGDKTEVPNTVQGDGSVSYTSGYGPDYEKNLDSDPEAKRIERQKMNQVLFDITNSIQETQANPFPPFFSSADNGGTPMSYIEGVIVSNAGLLYQSLENSNTSDLTNVSKWSGIGVKNNYVSHGSYFVGDIAKGSDGKQYYCNKPNNTGNQVNPVGDVTDTWREYPFKKVTTSNCIAYVFYDGLKMQFGKTSNVWGDVSWSGPTIKLKYSDVTHAVEFKGDYRVITGTESGSILDTVNSPSYQIVGVYGALKSKTQCRLFVLNPQGSGGWPGDITASYIAIGY